MIKSCGNCTHWVKIKKIKGLCEKFDYGWSNSDSGARCESHKKKKYKKDIFASEVNGAEND